MIRTAVGSRPGDEQAGAAFSYEASQEVDCFMRLHRMGFKAACQMVGLNPKHYVASGMVISYLPMPSDIEKRCAEIQATWSPGERRRRARFVTDNFARFDGLEVEIAAQARIDETLRERRLVAVA